jgi:hypothetical protein
MLRFRVRETGFGVALIVAVFALGFVAGSSQQPSPPTQNQSSEKPGGAYSNNEQHEPWWQRASMDPVAVFTLCLVLVGAFQVGLFYVQLKLIRVSLTDAKIAADAAKDGAKAAQDSADIARTSMVAGDRAYVHFNACRWTSHRQDSQSPVFWRLRPRWINSGNTSTRQLRLYVCYELLNAPLPENYKFTQIAHERRPVAMAPQGQFESQSRDFWGNELLAVKESRKVLYVWGVATYRDVFPNTPEHVTKFCVVATNITGNPLEPWDEKTNIFDIAFAHIDRHNCADEDCKEDNQRRAGLSEPP